MLQNNHKFSKMKREAAFMLYLQEGFVAHLTTYCISNAARKREVKLTNLYKAFLRTTLLSFPVLRLYSRKI